MRFERRAGPGGSGLCVTEPTSRRPVAVPGGPTTLAPRPAPRGPSEPCGGQSAVCPREARRALTGPRLLAALTSQQERVLIEILVAAVRQAAEGHPPAGRELGKRVSATPAPARMRFVPCADRWLWLLRPCCQCRGSGGARCGLGLAGLPHPHPRGRAIACCLVLGALAAHWAAGSAGGAPGHPGRSR